MNRPEVLPARPWTFPIPQITQLDNGLAIWAYDLPGQFILASTLVLELPINAEPEGLDGVATIAVRCLDEGTLTHPGTQFAAALEGVGAEFAGLVGLSTTQCLLDVPCDSFPEALSLFAEAVTTPAFDDSDVERIRANRRSEIDQQESRGSYVASTALRAALLADSRLAHPVGGNSTTVAAIRPTDVAQFQATHYRPEQAVLIVAGDLTGVDPAKDAAAAFGDWNPANQPVQPIQASPGTRRRRLIHREGAVQADIRLGWFGIDRRDPRWSDLQVALTVMGGSFNSRLNTVLREERGYTYGVHMSAHPYRTGGLIEVATSTRTEAAPDLIDEALDLLQASEPFTEEEVRAAVGYLTGSAPLAFGTADAVASQAASIAASHLDLDHVTNSLAALGRVTPESAIAAYRALIDPDQASLIVVADADQIADIGYEISR